MAAWLKSGRGACRLFFTANFVRVGERPGQGEQRVAGVGERIKKRRLELGWTQDQLGQKAGISKSFLSDLENGKRSVSAKNLLDIARALSVSLDFLMTGEASEKPVDRGSDPGVPGPVRCRRRAFVPANADAAGHAEADRRPPQRQEEGRPGVGGLAEVLRGREGIPGGRMSRLEHCHLKSLDLAAELGLAGAADPVDAHPATTAAAASTAGWPRPVA